MNRPTIDRHSAADQRSATGRRPASQRRRALLAAAAAAPLAGAGRAFAQERWPSRPVTIVSPYNPGGTNDTVARLAADRLQKALGQPFIVENRPGAAGIVGVQGVIRARPDGYTLLAGNNGALVIQSAGRVPSPYDPSSQLAPIVKLADAAAFMAISGELPAKTVPEFIAYAKKEQGKLNFSSSGVGSFGQFLGEYFKLKTGIEMVHVPSRGSAAALTELMAGRIHMLIDPLVLTQSKDPRVRVLATLNAERFEGYPEYPTLKEAGGPEIDLTGWFGLMGPAGLPAEIVERIVEVGRTMAADPEVRKSFLTAGIVPTALGGAAFGALIAADLKKVAEVRARAQITIE